jgi:hypothetical protein
MTSRLYPRLRGEVNGVRVWCSSGSPIRNVVWSGPPRPRGPVCMRQRGVGGAARGYDSLATMVITPLAPSPTSRSVVATGAIVDRQTDGLTTDSMLKERLIRASANQPSMRRGEDGGRRDLRTERSNAVTGWQTAGHSAYGQPVAVDAGRPSARLQGRALSTPSRGFVAWTRSGLAVVA